MTTIEEEETPLLKSLSTASNGWTPPGQFYDGTHYLLRGCDSNECPGELVVCVHGISSYHTTFNRVVNILLSKGFAVLQFDLIGRGFSEPSKNGKYGREEHVEQMYNLLNHLKLLRPQYLHIIGHSMGGCLSTLFTAQYGEFVKSLTLIAPAGLLGYFPIEFTKQLCPCLHGFMKKSFAKRENAIKSWKGDFYSHEGEALSILNERIDELSKGLDNNPHAFDAFWNSLMEFPLSNIGDDILKVASYSPLPIMIVWGKQDKSCPFSNLKLWEALIRQGRRFSFDHLLSLKTYDNAAHGICNEHFRLLSYDLLTFFNQNSVPEAR